MSRRHRHLPRYEVVIDIDGGMATEALIAHVVVSKFCDSLPLYRQAQMFKRPGHHVGSLDPEFLGGTCVPVAEADL